MNQHMYSDGVRVIKGDVISMHGNYGHVVDLLFPKTSDARDYACEDTGGVLFNVPSSLGVFVVDGFTMDEDIEFVSRGEEEKDDPHY